MTKQANRRPDTCCDSAATAEPEIDNVPSEAHAHPTAGCRYCFRPNPTGVYMLPGFGPIYACRPFCNATPTHVKSTAILQETIKPATLADPGLDEYDGHSEWCHLVQTVCWRCGEFRKCILYCPKADRQAEIQHEMKCEAEFAALETFRATQQPTAPVTPPTDNEQQAAEPAEPQPTRYVRSTQPRRTRPKGPNSPENATPIVILNADNPSKVGSARWQRFQALLEAKTVGEYLANGGRKRDLDRAVASGHIKLGSD